MLTGRCYCGAVRLTASAEPQTVAYCHCTDCRRWTGAPVAAFAALPDGSVTLSPDAAPFAALPGVERWTCPDCGSPLAARFDYLPGQIYLPLGVLDQAGALAPRLHSHADARLSWLHIEDDLPRSGGTARATLRGDS